VIQPREGRMTFRVNNNNNGFRHRLSKE